MKKHFLILTCIILTISLGFVNAQVNPLYDGNTQADIIIDPENVATIVETNLSGSGSASITIEIQCKLTPDVKFERDWWMDVQAINSKGSVIKLAEKYLSQGDNPHSILLKYTETVTLGSTYKVRILNARSLCDGKKNSKLIIVKGAKVTITKAL